MLPVREGNAFSFLSLVQFLYKDFIHSDFQSENIDSLSEEMMLMIPKSSISFFSLYKVRVQFPTSRVVSMLLTLTPRFLSFVTWMSNIGDPVSFRYFVIWSSFFVWSEFLNLAIRSRHISPIWAFCQVSTVHSAPLSKIHFAAAVFSFWHVLRTFHDVCIASQCTAFLLRTPSFWANFID